MLRAALLLCCACLLLLSAGGADASALRVGCSATWAPFIYLDAEGQLAGFDVDLRRELENRLGQTLEPRVFPFAELIPRLLAGEIDMILSTMSKTPERTKVVAFSRPYYISPPDVFVVRIDDDRIASLADLRGKILSCTAGSTHEAWVHSVQRELGIEALRTRPDNDEALRDVLAFRADAAYTDGNALRQRQRSGAATLKAAFRHRALAEDHICIAVRKEDSDLLQRLNLALAGMEDDDTLLMLRVKYDLE